MDLDIRLTDLRFHSAHGVLEQERIVGNEFSVSLVVTIPWSLRNQEIDALSCSISYADIFSLVEEVMSQPVKLLETVVSRIVKEILERWPEVLGGYVTVAKLFPPIPRCMGEASVTLHF